MTVVKQFGSLGKKFRKNLAKITHTGSFRSAKDTVDYARYIFFFLLLFFAKIFILVDVFFKIPDTVSFEIL